MKTTRHTIAGITLCLTLNTGFVDFTPGLNPAPVMASTMMMADPTAEQIIDKYIEATGGRAAYESVKSRVTTGKLSIPAQGMNASMVTYQKSPNLTYARIELEGLGVVERGFNGEVGWEKNPQMGTRIIDGEERKQMEREATLGSELEWKQNYPKAETKGVEDVEGKKCYKVELTDKEGNTQTRFYNVDTGLIDRIDMVAKSPMGELPVVVIMSDYRDVGGIKVPFKAVQNMKSLGMSYEMITEKAEANVDIPADKFELPEDVKALAKKTPPTTQPK